VQLDLNLIYRNVEKDILPYCEREKIALLAYFPLGHSKLPSDHRLDLVSSSHGKTRAQAAL
jgi:diketogulonate reductase-like aldo/keto reductase